MKHVAGLAVALLAASLGTATAQQPSIPVLTYHRFDPSIAKSATIVTNSVFTAQMRWLQTHDIAVVKLADAVAALHGGKPVGAAVALTADDGWRSVYTDMFPILRRMNLPATLFINPPMIGHGGAYLTWPMLQEMVQSGLVDVQAHTQDHPNFNTERARHDPAGYARYIDHEISDSRAPITEHLKLPADQLAWPFGIFDATLEAAAEKSGYKSAFALGSRAMAEGDPAFALPRYQVYDTDTETRFAWIATGHPRGVGLHTATGKPAP